MTSLKKDIDKLINWHELSRILTGKGQNVRPNKHDKYAAEITSLRLALNEWKNKHI